MTDLSERIGKLDEAVQKLTTAKMAANFLPATATAEAANPGAAAPAGQSQVNTAAGPVKSLADYVPCVLQYPDEENYRNGFVRNNLGSQSANARKIVMNPDLVADGKTQNVLNLVDSMAGLNSLLIATALESKRFIQPGTSAIVAAILAQPGTASAGQPDVGCSQSILSYDEANAIFGRAIARTYIVIQVNARNLSEDKEFLMHDVQVAVADVQNDGSSATGTQKVGFKDSLDANGVTTDGNLRSRFVSGRDKTLARGVAITGQLDSPRNIAGRVIEAIGAVGGAASLAVGTVGAAGTFKDAMQVFTTAVVPGFGKLFPDHTIEQLNRLNDLGFSSSSAYKIVIPKNGTVPFVTFLPTKVFAEKYNKWPQRDMWDFQKNTFVVIAGKHITETDDDLQVATMKCPQTTNAQYLDFSQASGANLSCSVTGRNLQKLTSMRLVSAKDYTDKTTADSNNTSTSPPNTSGTVSFTLTDLYKLPAPLYIAYLDPGATVNGTATTLRVSLPPYISGATSNATAITQTSPLSVAACTATTPCSIVLQGHNLNLIQSAALKAKDNSATTATVTLVPAGATDNGASRQISLFGLSIAAGAAAVPYNLQVTAGGDPISPAIPLYLKP